MGRTKVDVRRTEQRRKEAAWVHLLKCMTFYRILLAWLKQRWTGARQNEICYWIFTEELTGLPISLNLNDAPRICSLVWAVGVLCERAHTLSSWVFLCVFWGKKKVWLERQTVIRKINASIIEICGFILCLWIEQDDKQESAGALKKESLPLWAECYDGKHAKHYLLLLCWIYIIYSPNSSLVWSPEGSFIPILYCPFGPNVAVAL